MSVLCNGGLSIPLGSVSHPRYYREISPVQGTGYQSVRQGIFSSQCGRSIFNSRRKTFGIKEKEKSERITAIYDAYGYTAYSHHPEREDPEELHQGGNHAMESTAILDSNDSDALPLETIKKYAESTAREIASERGADYIGVEMAEEEYISPRNN